LNNNDDRLPSRHAASRVNARARTTDAEYRPFVPILQRAIDLGRGPEGLISWLRGHLRSSTGTDHSVNIVHRLATELARSAGVKPKTNWHRATLRNGLNDTTMDEFLNEATGGVQSESRPLAAASACRSRETIIVAEDDPSVRELIRYVLNREGFRVFAAKHGREAIAIADAYDGLIELLVTDVIMPEMSGVKLAGHLCVSRPEIRVLFLSGSTDEAIDRYGIRRSDSAFLEKPFTPTELVRRINEVLCAASVQILPAPRRPCPPPGFEDC
jgi:CheY-like chemotaxis protein